LIKMKICITGLIGSGKSSVLSILKKYGFDIYSTDEINNELLKDDSYLKELKENFGTGIFINGKLDKKALAKIIFTDESKRKLLNSLSHPAIINRLIDIIKGAKGDIFVEIPLLADSNLAPLFDKVWLVESKNEVRLQRIMKRDIVTKELALAKISSQKRYHDDLKRLATDIIYNNGDLNYLEKQINKLLQR